MASPASEYKPGDTSTQDQRAPKAATSWLRATLLAGLFVLLPFGVVYFLLFQVWKLLRSKMYQWTDLLDVGTDLRLGVALLLAALFLLLLLFIAGIFVRAGGSTKLQLMLEGGLLSLIPGYGLMRMRLAEKLGQKTAREPGLLMTANGLQPVFIMERDADRAMVFIPHAPAGDSGILAVVDTARLKPLDVEVRELEDLMHLLGRGLLQKIPPSMNP